MPFITITCIKSLPPLTSIQYDLKLSGTVVSQAFIRSLMLLKLKNSPPPHPFQKRNISEVIDDLSPQYGAYTRFLTCHKIL